MLWTLIIVVAFIIGAIVAFNGWIEKQRGEDGNKKLIAGIGSSKAQYGPLIVLSQRQTRVYQQLVCGQIGRLAPVEDEKR